MNRQAKLLSLTLVATVSITSTSFAGGSQCKKAVKHHVNQVIRQVVSAPPTVRQVIVNRPPVQTQQVIVDPGYGGQPVLAYFSPRLGARFEIQSIQIGNFEPVWAARIVSQPEYGSPLHQLGLTVGDVITRLDGNPVSTEHELERHVYDTTVRYVKAGSDHVHQDTMYVENRFFQPPVYPGQPGGCQHHTLRP